MIVMSLQLISHQQESSSFVCSRNFCRMRIPMHRTDSTPMTGKVTSRAIRAMSACHRDKKRSPRCSRIQPLKNYVLPQLLLFTISQPFTEFVVETTFWFIRRRSSFRPDHRSERGRRPETNIFWCEFPPLKKLCYVFFELFKEFFFTGLLWCDCQNGGRVKTWWCLPCAAGHKWNSPGFSPPCRQSGRVQTHLRRYNAKDIKP